MPKLKSKLKRNERKKPLAKAKSKAKTKLKLKKPLKSKIKSKPKSKVKTKAIAKKKPQSKTKPKPKLKSKPKPKLKPQIKKLKSKPKSKSKKDILQFTKLQKEILLLEIEKIVGLRKGTKYGLKSFDQIDRILDEYNQHYTTIPEKFDAIVHYGMAEDPSIVRKHVFVPVTPREDDEVELYKLLSLIGKGKVAFMDAKNEMITIHEKASAKKHVE